MLDLFKDITLKEYSRAGIGAVAIIVIVWYLYSENRKHQISLEKRVERLEINYEGCLTTKFESMRNQVDKSNYWLEKTDRHLTELELIIKNK
jgi:hypothetical protein